MKALDAVERLAPAGADATTASPSSRTRSSSFLRSVTSGTRSSPRGSSSSAPSTSRSSSREVRAQPRDAAELERVRQLVQRDPAQQLVRGRVEALRGVRQVGRDEQQPGGLLRLQHGELVLAEHAPGEEPGDRAGLERQHAAGDRAQRAGAAGQLLRRGLEHERQRLQVGVDPARRGRPARRRARRRRRRAPCRRRRGARLPRRPGELLERRGSPAGCMFGDTASHGPREVPIDHMSSLAGASYAGQTGTLATSARPSRRARGDHGRARLEVERRAQRVVVGDEGHLAARLAHDQLRRRGVDGAAALAARPSRRSAPAATWHSETAIAPIARSRCAVSSSASADCTTQRGSADSSPSTSSLPSRSRRSTSVGRAARRRARRPRRAAPPTPPRGRSRGRSRTRRRPSSARRRPRSRARGAAGRAWRSASRRSGR